MKICFIFLMGIFVGVLGFYIYQVDTYSKLRKEIRMKTRTDITYPYDNCIMNETIYGGRLNTESCR